MCISTSIYIHIYICMHTCTYVYIYIYIYIYIFISMYAHKHTHKHKHAPSLFLTVCMYVVLCTHIQTHTHTHAHENTHTHVRARAYTHTQTHTHAHAHDHIFCTTRAHGLQQYSRCMHARSRAHVSTHRSHVPPVHIPYIQTRAQMRTCVHMHTRRPARTTPARKHAHRRDQPQHARSRGTRAWACTRANILASL